MFSRNVQLSAKTSVFSELLRNHTFDAHDPRVQNAIPLSGFETVRPTYQFVKGLLGTVKDLKIDSQHMMSISPDEGATERAVYLANVLNLDMGMFYKRRDCSRVVNG